MPKLGRIVVSRQGYGAMGLSGVYGRAEDEASIATLHRAIDLRSTSSTPRQATDRLGAATAQVSLAWVLSRGVVPIPGTRHITHLEANWAANDLLLAPDDLTKLEAAFPLGSTVGERYPAEQLKLVPPSPPVAAA